MQHSSLCLCLAVVVGLLAGSAVARAGAEWRPAGWQTRFEDALARAKAVNRPLFVYFDAVWCSWCQQYKRDTLEKSVVRRAIARDFVPVVVDYDARPDLMQRYGGRGLPYTVMLAPDGRVINRFVGVVTFEDLLDLLRAARTSPHAPVLPAVSKAVRVTALDRAGYEAFRAAWLERLEDLYDPERRTLAGRFETGATLKRPTPLTWIYLLEHGLWPKRVRAAARAERERLWDQLDGGFFNFLDPAREEYLETSKLLEANAWIIAWQALAGKTDPAARAAARAGWHYLREVLWDDAHGGFFQAQIADNAYYRLAPRERLRRRPPPVQRIKRVDTNAQAVWALVRAGRSSGEREWLVYAAHTLRFLLEQMMQDGRLYHHWQDGRLSVPALPQDVFWLLAAAGAMEEMSLRQDRHAGLAALKAEASRWLAAQMRKNSADVDLLDNELAGLIAWTTQDWDLPAGARDWALRRLTIEAETAPDELVIGLMAWERFLGIKRW